MKLGISTYSLHSAFSTGELTLEGVIETIADLGAEHAEIVPLGINLVENPELIDQIVRTAAGRGLELSNYAIGANFAGLETAEMQREVERVKREVDVCAALGIQRMRHDVASSNDLTITHFWKSFHVWLKPAEKLPIMLQVWALRPVWRIMDTLFSTAIVYRRWFMP